MSAANAVTLVDVHKSFRVYHSNRLKDAMVRVARRQPLFDRRPVLRGVTLDIRAGEAFGIMGRNGAGKSTLFRLMCKIVRPDSGTITMNGRVASLVELTAGLVPDLTGAENVLLNAAVLGLSRNQIRTRFERILEFAELEDFAETPVRYYSSGMQARLGFSVAIHVDADILLIDEALAVGDVAFQDKCVGRMRELGSAGRTIVFVSHNGKQILEVCDRAAWLDEGVIAACGPADEVLWRAEDAIKANRMGPARASVETADGPHPTRVQSA